MDVSSPWRDLTLDWRPSPRVLQETLAGGQAFRWQLDANSMWTGQWAQHVVQLRQKPDTSLQWRPLTPSANTEFALLRYLGTDTDFNHIAEVLPWRSDPVLANALERWEGLRILRQPFGETLLAFLCSSTKRIPQIAVMQSVMVTRFGQNTIDGMKAIPSWADLHQAGESALRECGLGYRARYVSATASYLADKPGWLDDTEALPYTEAKARLLSLPGVGEKIADCVLLFGAGRMEAFPVDTWMLKAMERLYGLSGWRPEQVAAFGRLHFGAYAGYAQQVLFAGERSA